MCGILGVIFRDRTRRADEARLATARDTLTHRGPDDAGLWIKPGAALAHRRLSVIDLAHGHQPMVAGDDAAAIVYNGELYNYRELRPGLVERGADIRTDSDTEVMLASLMLDDAKALDSFNGMYAFGFWRQDQRRLLLARDRMGQKPVYWFMDDEVMIFASELKAMLTWLGRLFDIDPLAVDAYLSRGYIQSPRTIFKGIYKLPAACMLTLDAERWQTEVTRYWKPATVEAVASGGFSDAAAVDQLDDLLSDAVNMRLVSDVPIGCLLSGGIDSSLITAMASKARREAGGEPINAFSIGFSESQHFNELPYAEMVAKQWGCKWRSRNVEAGDFLDQLDDVTHYFDEPFCNFAMFPMRRLAELAREELVVVLSGQGGDELSAGYPGRYQWTLDAQSGKPVEQAKFVDELTTYLDHTNIVGWANGRSKMYTPAMADALRQAGAPLADSHGAFVGAPAGDLLNRVLYQDATTNLPDYLVCCEERMTMAASLEGRNPLLDWRVAEFMMSLPAGMKVRGGGFKWILMELARRYDLGPAVDRPKRGFTPPIGLWIRQRAAALQQRFQRMPTGVERMFTSSWRDYLAGGAYQDQMMMPLLYSLVLASWAERWADYIGDWPAGGSTINSTGGGAAAAAVKPVTSDRWRATAEERQPARVAESQWFEQAMKNLPADACIHLVGDDDGWFSFVARASGLTCVAVDPPGALTDASQASGEGARDRLPDAVVVIGLKALTGLITDPAAMLAPAASGVFVAVAGFATKDQKAVEQVVQQLQQTVTLEGMQAVEAGVDDVTGPGAVLILRGRRQTTPAALE